MERWRPAKTTRASGMPSQRQLDEVIGRGLVTVMASSSANVDGPPTAGGHVTEGALAPEVRGVGVLRSNTCAAVGVTNASAVGDTVAAAAGGTVLAAAGVTNASAAGDTNGAAAAAVAL